MFTVTYSLQVSESAGAAEECFSIGHDYDTIRCFLPGLDNMRNGVTAWTYSGKVYMRSLLTCVSLAALLVTKSSSYSISLTLFILSKALQHRKGLIHIGHRNQATSHLISS